MQASRGGEASVGQVGLKLDAALVYEANQKHLKSIFINVSYVNSANNFSDSPNGANHNIFRTGGTTDDRPTLLTNVNFDFKSGEWSHYQLTLGSQKVSGLAPLNAIESVDFKTTPFGIFVRYDQGVQISHELKNKLASFLKTSFAIYSGDWIRGQRSVISPKGIANSYPSFGYSAELNLVPIFSKVFNFTKELQQRNKVYTGCTGAIGDTGSTGSKSGEKRVHDDLICYFGSGINFASGIDFEVRYFGSKYTRSRENAAGIGRNEPLSKSKSSGLEISLKNFNSYICAQTDLYFTTGKLNLLSPTADGEFTQKQITEVTQRVITAQCNNINQIKGLSLGFSYGHLTPNDPPSAGELWSGQYGINPGRLINLYLKYKFNLL